MVFSFFARLFSSEHLGLKMVDKINENTAHPRMTADTDLVADAKRLRAFNRFHTALVGALDRRILDSPFPLAEARILFELAEAERRREPVDAAGLARALRVDKGRLSRLIAALSRGGWLRQGADDGDRRRRPLSLTDAGRRAAADLAADATDAAAALLRPLAPAVRAAALDGLATAQAAFGGPDDAVEIGPPQPGEVATAVARQSALYAASEGWGAAYEALACEIVAGFLKRNDAARERAWIARRRGRVLGSVFAMAADAPRTTQVRLLYVEPDARGAGLGRRLVEGVLDFARAKGDDRVMLWTNARLAPAGRLYAALGFERVASAPHRQFGPEDVGQTYERDL